MNTPNPMVARMEYIRFVLAHRLSGELVQNGILGGEHRITLERCLDANDYVARMKSMFWANKSDFELPPVPVTWWDHFKRDAIPTFTRLLRLRVRERRETLTAATLFTDIPLDLGARSYCVETHSTADGGSDGT